MPLDILEPVSISLCYIGSFEGDGDGGEVSPPYFEMVDLLGCSSCTSVKTEFGTMIWNETACDCLDNNHNLTF